MLRTVRVHVRDQIHRWIDTFVGWWLRRNAEAVNRGFEAELSRHPRK